jgi:hypothetical protein
MAQEINAHLPKEVRHPPVLQCVVCAFRGLRVDVAVSTGKPEAAREVATNAF